MPTFSPTRHKSINSALSFTQKSLPQKRFLVRMQLTLDATLPTPHDASRLVQAMSAWSVITRHALSRHCRGARVYGQTTTTMHDMSTPRTPPIGAAVYFVHSMIFIAQNVQLFPTARRFSSKICPTYAFFQICYQRIYSATGLSGRVQACLVVIYCF